MSEEIVNGGLPHFSRMLFMAFRMVGCPIILASSLRLLGNSNMDIPMSMVRIPWPGRNNIRKPAKRKIAPTIFLRRWPNTRSTGW